MWKWPCLESNPGRLIGSRVAYPLHHSDTHPQRIETDTAVCNSVDFKLSMMISIFEFGFFFFCIASLPLCLYVINLIITYFHLTNERSVDQHEALVSLPAWSSLLLSSIVFSGDHEVDCYTEEITICLSKDLISSSMYPFRSIGVIYVVNSVNSSRNQQPAFNLI